MQFKRAIFDARWAKTLGDAPAIQSHLEEEARLYRGVCWPCGPSARVMRVRAVSSVRRTLHPAWMRCRERSLIVSHGAWCCADSHSWVG